MSVIGAATLDSAGVSTVGVYREDILSAGLIPRFPAGVPGGAK